MDHYNSTSNSNSSERIIISYKYKKTGNGLSMPRIWAVSSVKFDISAPDVEYIFSICSNSLFALLDVCLACFGIYIVCVDNINNKRFM